MRNTACALFLCVLFVGCTSAADLALSALQQQDLEDHFSTSIETQQGLAGLGFLGAYGELSLADYSYVPPTPQNGMVGTLTRTGPFAFGTGTVTIMFTTTADGQPIDPLDPNIDMASYSQVDMDVQADFDGDNLGGQPLQALADFDLTTIPDGTDISVATVNGAFDVLHDGHASMIEVTDLQLTIDRNLGEIIDVRGDLTGLIQIPNFAADAFFTAQGLGDQISVDIQAAVTDLLLLLDL